MKTYETSNTEAVWLRWVIRRQIRRALAARTGESAEYKVKVRVYAIPPRISNCYFVQVMVKDDPLERVYEKVIDAAAKRSIRQEVRRRADLLARDFTHLQKAMMRSNAPKEES